MFGRVCILSANLTGSWLRSEPLVYGLATHLHRPADCLPRQTVLARFPHKRIESNLLATQFLVRIPNCPGKERRRIPLYGLVTFGFLTVELFQFLLQTPAKKPVRYVQALGLNFASRPAGLPLAFELLLGALDRCETSG